MGILAGCSTAPTNVGTNSPRPSAERPASDGPPKEQRDVNLIPDAKPQAESFSRFGNMNPYQVNGRSYRVYPTAKEYVERGVASWYGVKFHGQPTSTREMYDVWGMTAAHRNLPLPTYAKVTNLDNGRSVVVKINDRGPFYDDRLIDLSYAAAKKLGFAENGKGNVEVRAITFDDGPSLPSILAEEKEKARLASQKTRRETSPPSRKRPTKAAGKEKKPSLKGKTYLQVGAFSRKNDAETLRKKLLDSELHKEVRVLDPARKGKLYRVQVGPLDNHAEKAQVNRMLAQLGFREALVIVD